MRKYWKWLVVVVVAVVVVVVVSATRKEHNHFSRIINFHAAWKYYK